MTESRYLTILWVYVALVGASIVAAYQTDYPETLAAAYEATPESWLFSGSWPAIGVLAALSLSWLVGLAGLFRFKAWARTLSLVSTVAAFLAYTHFGVSLATGVEMALQEAATTVWGAVLAAAYFSPVSERFVGASNSFKAMAVSGTP